MFFLYNYCLCSRNEIECDCDERFKESLTAKWTERVPPRPKFSTKHQCPIPCKPLLPYKGPKGMPAVKCDMGKIFNFFDLSMELNLTPDPPKSNRSNRNPRKS